MKNITVRKLLPIAHTYILLSLFFYWFETSFGLNPVALTFFVVFGLHLFVAKGAFKFIFPSIFAALNLYMFLALFSELSEFTTFNMEAFTMLSVGTLYLGLNIAGAVIMMLNISAPTVIAEEVK